MIRLHLKELEFLILFLPRKTGKKVGILPVRYILNDEFEVHI